MRHARESLYFPLQHRVLMFPERQEVGELASLFTLHPLPAYLSLATSAASFHLPTYAPASYRHNHGLLHY